MNKNKRPMLLTRILAGSAVFVGALGVWQLHGAQAEFYTHMAGEVVFPVEGYRVFGADNTVPTPPILLPGDRSANHMNLQPGLVGGGLDLVFGYHFYDKTAYQRYGVELSYDYWAVTDYNDNHFQGSGASNITADSSSVLSHNVVAASFSYKLPVLTTNLSFIPAVGLGFDVMGWKNNQYATSYSGVAAVMIPKLALQYDLPVGRGTVSFGTYLKYYLPFHNVKMTNSDDANIYGNYKLGAALAWGFSVGGSF